MLDPFDLNFRHLRALPLIARHKRMGAAAEAISLSQPALTQGLAKIERQLGAPLFSRELTGMEPTAEGLALIARIEPALRQLGEGVRQAGRSPRGFARPDHLMTATQLRAFLALADAGSYIEAAHVTRWSQPALHRAVRDLQQLCGALLVERRGRGVVLTRDGRRLARAIRLASAELAAGISEMQPDASLRARLVIGAMPLCRARLLPGAVAGLLRIAPEAAIEVVEGSWRELVDPLRDGTIDLMIGALRPEAPPDTAQEALFENRLAVVARSGHPLAGPGAPDIAALSRFPWIVGPERSPMRAHWERMFAGARPHAPVVCGSAMAIRGILIDSDCLALLSPEQIGMELDSGALTLIGPPRADMVRVIGVTTRADWRPTRLAALFLGLLREQHFRKMDQA